MSLIIIIKKNKKKKIQHLFKRFEKTLFAGKINYPNLVILIYFY